MDGENYGGLESFERVWQRVTGETPSAKDSADLETIERFLEDEARDAAFYRALAKKTHKYSSELRRMCADEERHFDALQVERYLLAGEAYYPAPSCPLPGRTLSALRMAYMGETRGAEEYRSAAGRTGDMALRELYLSNAEDETRHAVTLRRLIGGALI